MHVGDFIHTDTLNRKMLLTPEGKSKMKFWGVIEAFTKKSSRIMVCICPLSFGMFLLCEHMRHKAVTCSTETHWPARNALQAVVRRIVLPGDAGIRAESQRGEWASLREPLLLCDLLRSTTFARKAGGQPAGLREYALPTSCALLARSSSRRCGTFVHLRKLWQPLYLPEPVCRYLKDVVAVLPTTLMLALPGHVSSQDAAAAPGDTPSFPCAHAMWSHKELADIQLCLLPPNATAASRLGSKGFAACIPMGAKNTTEVADKAFKFTTAEFEVTVELQRRSEVCC